MLISYEFARNISGKLLVEIWLKLILAQAPILYPWKHKKTFGYLVFSGDT